MRLIQELRLKLSDAEKQTLVEAADLVQEIVDALISNKANGHSVWQEGLNAPQAFWDIKKAMERIETEELIP